MIAWIVALGALAVAGAAATVLAPSLRLGVRALAVTLALGAALALALGSPAVAAAEAAGAVIVFALGQLVPAPDGSRPARPSVAAIVLSAVPPAILLVTLAWVAVQTAWPAASLPGATLSQALRSSQLVPLWISLVLVATGALAYLTLREPRAPHRPQPHAPRRLGSPSRTPPRGRGRR